MGQSIPAKNTGAKRVVFAAIYSAKGFKSAFKHEEAFRTEVILAMIMLPLAFFLEVSQVERILMVASVIWVLVVELLNSGIEAVVDRVGLEHHELAGRAKDMGSAAVMLSLMLTGYIWAEVLLI